jgi:hypothetical protein
MTIIKNIQNRIYEIRGERVLLDKDLADLYEVPTKSLNLAVKRNIKRFPKDFMFQLTKDEFESLRFQIEASNKNTNPLRFQIETLDNSSPLRLQTETLKKGRDNTVNICPMPLLNRELPCSAVF